MTWLAGGERAGIRRANLRGKEDIGVTSASSGDAASGPMLAEEHRVDGDARHIRLQRRRPRYQTNMVDTVLGCSFPM